MRQWVAHVDMDCFFVSCERVKNPAYAGKPLVVAGGAASIAKGRPRGVVTCASYEVRRFGVRAGMSLSMAVRLAPAAIYIEGSHGLYGEFSDAVFGALREFSPMVERASVDEFFLDLSGCARAHGFGGEDWTARDLEFFAHWLRAEVKRLTKLPCSVGIGSNKRIAKIASDQSKPGGVCVVDRGQEETFLDPLPVGVLPGVGKVTGRTLDLLGVRRVSDLKRLGKAVLGRMLGAWGEYLYRAAHGQDGRVVEEGDRRAFVPLERGALCAFGESSRCVIFADKKGR